MFLSADTGLKLPVEMMVLVPNDAGLSTLMQALA
jgi:hypothetical protein